VADDYAYLNGLSAHPDRPGDTSNLNPAFATQLASALRQANAAGLHVGVESGFREPTQTGSAYDAGGNSSHTYGLAADISGLGGANSAQAQQWQKIAEANGLHNPYGIGDAAEFNHWQLPPQPLEKSPQLLASLQAAKATGNFSNVWNAYNTGSAAAPTAQGAQGAQGATPAPLMFAGLNANARGMRNNNPGNLVADDWTKGLPGYKGSDGKFAIFDTPQHGATALDQNLSGYGSKGINTPLGVASTWAPASDNNDPKSYGGRIAAALGVGPNDKIDLSDPAVRGKVSQAIASVENGPGNSAGFAMAAAPAAAPIGATINTTGAVGGGKLPGFGTQAASDQFTQGLQKMGLTPGQGQGGSSGGAGATGDFEPPQPSPMVPGPNPQQFRNVAPAMAPAMAASLSGYTPKPYGQTLNSFSTPLDWGSAPPGSSPYFDRSVTGSPMSVANPNVPGFAGTMGAPTSPQGTTINSLQQLQMLSNPAYQQMLSQGGY
jgi:hypothetical protein